MRVVGSLATKFAPPFSLVLHYFIGGSVFNFIGILFLLLFNKFSPPFYQSEYAALVHVFLLGYVMMIIFGALYQLIPVVLEIPVFSFKIAYIQFYIYTVGIFIFTFSLYYTEFLRYAILGSFLIYVSIFLFIFNFFMSVRKLEKLSTTGKFLISANIFLFIGTTLGLITVFNFFYGFFPERLVNLILSHIIFTLFGFVMMVVFGVAVILLPMFSLAHKFNDRYINLTFYISVLSISLGGFFTLFIKNNAFIYSAFILIFVGMFVYILQVLEIYRKRARKTPDIGIDTMFFSHFFLLLSLISGILIPFSDRFVFLFGFSLIFGFLNLLIYGSLYKIVPFLTWFHRFSDLVGKKKVPMLTEMLPERFTKYQVITAIIGTLVYMLGIYLNNYFTLVSGVIIMTVSSSVFLFVIFYVLNYRLEEE